MGLDKVKVKTQCLCCDADMGFIEMERWMWELEGEKTTEYDECDGCIRVRHLEERGYCDCHICVENGK